MAKLQKRDKAYYEERLIRDHPEIYADLVDEKYRTVTEAAIAAGLKKPRTRLQELKNAWEKAGLSEKKAFLVWLRTSAGMAARKHAKTTGVAPLPSAPVDGDGFVEPWAKKRIQDIMTTRSIDIRKIRDEMGLSSFDTSLESALQQHSGRRLKRQTTITALEKWLTANASV